MKLQSSNIVVPALSHYGIVRYNKIAYKDIQCSNGIARSQIDGLVQERCNSSALAMELRLSCTNPSRWHSEPTEATHPIPHVCGWLSELLGTKTADNASSKPMMTNQLSMNCSYDIPSIKHTVHHMNCLFKRLLMQATERTLKLSFTGPLCQKIPPVTSGSPSNGAVMWKSFSCYDIIFCCGEVDQWKTKRKQNKAQYYCVYVVSNLLHSVTS